MDCIIIEDQAPAQRVLQKYIEDFGGLNLVGTFASALQALDFLATQKVDLIFLDIHLPKLSGIDFLKTLSHPPKIILTTAFTEYAVEGYELDVVDYLVKPFSFERFIKAINKLSVDSTQLAANLSEFSESIFIKSGYEYIRLFPRDVLFIQSDMDYTEIYLSDKKYLTTETLSHWETQLEPFQFVRIHRSYLVNPAKIQKVVGNHIILSDVHSIPIGRTYKESFLRDFIRH